MCRITEVTYIATSQWHKSPKCLPLCIFHCSVLITPPQLLSFIKLTDNHEKTCYRIQYKTSVLSVSKCKTSDLSIFYTQHWHYHLCYCCGSFAYLFYPIVFTVVPPICCITLLLQCCHSTVVWYRCYSAAAYLWLYQCHSVKIFLQTLWNRIFYHGFRFSLKGTKFEVHRSMPLLKNS